MHREALERRRLATGIARGDDGKFSTKEILRVAFGDLERERTRNEAASADLREMKRDLQRQRLLPIELVRTVLDEMSVAIRQVIEHAPLGLREREAIFANLRKLGEQDFTAAP